MANEYNILLIVRSSIAAGALLSCILVFILAAAFRATSRDKDAGKLPTLRLILYITLASTVRSVIILIQVAPVIYHPLYCNYTDGAIAGNCWYCVITGYLYRTVSMMGVLLTLAVTVHMLLVTFAVKYSWKFEVGYVLVPIILPLTYTWISIAYHKDQGLFQDWCGYDTDIKNQIKNIMYIDMPRLVAEAINTFLVIVTVFCGMPRRYTQMKKDGEEVGVWMKQVLPILVHSVFYLGMNWFSLSDHLYRSLECSTSPDECISNGGEHLQLAHAITSAGRGLLVGITFTVYYLIMMYIRWKHQNITVNYSGMVITISASSSINESESLTKSKRQLKINDKNYMYFSTSIV